MNKGIGIRTADIYLRFPEIIEEEADELKEFLEDEKILYEGATDVFIDLQKKAELREHYKHLYSEVKKQYEEADYDRHKLFEENQQLKKQKDDVVECCKNSIKSINEKLENNKELFEVVDGKIIYLNDYQVVRLKAIRMKCKEILRMLGEIDDR